MASLTERLLKSSSLPKRSSTLSSSALMDNRKLVSTKIPMLNVAFSGEITGGLGCGLTMIAGPSKHFKTLFGLVAVSAYMEEYKDAICLFYDSEFGAGKAYFESANIDPARVVHTPIMNLEELKFDIVQQLEHITVEDKVIVFIDSIGNLASKKEIEDAKDEKSVADMTRAKQMKSLWRMVTPYLNLYDIPVLAVNHTYVEQKMYGQAVVSGGCMVAGTKIRMADGTTRAIEDVVLGEEVITMNRSNKVSAVWDPDTLEEGTPECYEIVFDDGTQVTVSDKHKFMVDGKWKEAEQLCVGEKCQTYK